MTLFQDTITMRVFVQVERRSDGGVRVSSVGTATWRSTRTARSSRSLALRRRSRLLRPKEFQLDLIQLRLGGQIL
jgi:CRISPR/Cas system Type II protein with McrA/HNH and RuvC-like nuclease domain